MKKDPHSAQSGVVTLAVPVLLLIIIAVILYILFSQGIIKAPTTPSLPGLKKEPTVSLQNQYQNPFDKSAQYVNPFSEYKNPFDALKK